MKRHYKGKTVVLTGAGSGMGRHLAIHLATFGANLALSDINEEGLAETLAMMPNTNAIKVSTDCLDVSDREAVSAYAIKTMETFERIDILINNAGIAGSDKMMDDYEYQDYDRVINVNLWGTIHPTHSFLPHLKENPGSQIVNLSSIFGMIAPPGVGAYVVSKFAVRGFTEALRSELSEQNISVTSIHPGMIATNIVAAADFPADIIEKYAALGMPPDKAALKILRGVSKRKARVLFGGDALLVDVIQRLFPSRYRGIVFPLFALFGIEASVKTKG